MAKRRSRDLWCSRACVGGKKREIAVGRVQKTHQLMRLWKIDPSQFNLNVYFSKMLTLYYSYCKKKERLLGFCAAAALVCSIVGSDTAENLSSPERRLEEEAEVATASKHPT